MKNKYITPIIDVEEMEADSYIIATSDTENAPSVTDKYADSSEQLVRKNDYVSTDFCSSTDQDFDIW